MAQLKRNGTTYDIKLESNYDLEAVKLLRITVFKKLKQQDAISLVVRINNKAAELVQHHQ